MYSERTLIDQLIHPKKIDIPSLLGIDSKNLIHYGADSSIYKNGPLVTRVYDKARENLGFVPPIRDLENYAYQMMKIGKGILGKKLELPGLNVFLAVNPILNYGQVLLNKEYIPYSVSGFIPGLNLRAYLHLNSNPGLIHDVRFNSNLAEIFTSDLEEKIDDQLSKISKFLNENVLRKTTKLSTLNMTPVLLANKVILIVTDIRNFVYPNRVFAKFGGAAGYNRNSQD